MQQARDNDGGTGLASESESGRVIFSVAAVTSTSGNGPSITGGGAVVSGTGDSEVAEPVGNGVSTFAASSTSRSRRPCVANEEIEVNDEDISEC